jgi:Kef-type K+ transport system membrane component KefB
VLLALVVIVVAARILGAVFRWLHQPQVMGEVVAGLLPGPSFLGWLAPQLSSRLLSPAIAPLLAIIAQVGVILFMFLVGLELNTNLLRQRTRATIDRIPASWCRSFWARGSRFGFIHVSPAAEFLSPRLLCSSA